MRVKLVSLSLVALATALPAAAYPNRDRGYSGYDPVYEQQCQNEKKNKQAVGAVLGGLIGGVAGSNIASRNARTEGTVLGAVVGAVAGSEIARDRRDCSANYQSGRYIDDYDRRGDEYYGRDGYSEYGRLNRPGDDWSQHGRYDELAGGPYDPYNSGYTSAPRDCRVVEQVTRLPDGREVYRPVEACRYDRGGDWIVNE